jgi:hypothetical protein
MVGHDQTAPVSDLHRADLRPDLDRLGAALAGGSWQEAAPAAFRLSIPALALFFAVLILTDGLGEELGWRGFALPRAPAALAGGDGQCHWCGPRVPRCTARQFGCSSLDICAKSILFTWVFVRTRKSVLIAVLLHASTNLFAVSPVIISDLRLPILAMIAKWLLVIIVGLILIRLQPKPTGAQKSER